MLLHIRHLTRYRYAQPVKLGRHRLLLRALEGHDVQIRQSSLRIEPAHRLRWIHDIFDNSIAWVDFQEPADQVLIESSLQVEQFNANPFDFVLEPYACELPFTYDASELTETAAFREREYPGATSAIESWIRPFLNLQGRARTLDFLTAINKSAPHFFQYGRREEAGVQSPGETLKRRTGSCRDFTVLLMETARHLGLAARFVSGYLCSNATEIQSVAAGATHAWAEIYLPGAGWKGFDPTCGILAADSHVRTAVTRTAAQASPVSGSFTGPANALIQMQVEVDTRQDTSGA